MSTDSNRDEERQNRREKMRRKDQDKKRGGFDRNLKSEPYRRRHTNIYYFDEEDAAARTYRVGPSVRIPFSEQAQVGLFYWYSFENDGMDANVFNMSLSLNF